MELYTIDPRPLGTGAFGEVFSGVHRRSLRRVAIKMLKKTHFTSVGDMDRAMQELAILSSLSHPNVIKLLEVVQDSACVGLVMEFAGGGTLGSLLASSPGGCMAEDDAREAFLQVLRGMRYLHGQRVVHRDIKPENILVGAEGVLKVADFGLSVKNVAGTSASGTPLYTAPEVLFPERFPDLQKRRGATSGGGAGSGSGRAEGEGGATAEEAGSHPTLHTSYDLTLSDVWSLGCTLFKMVTGAYPFPAKSRKALKEMMLMQGAEGGGGGTEGGRHSPLPLRMEEGPAVPPLQEAQQQLAGERAPPSPPSSPMGSLSLVGFPASPSLQQQPQAQQHRVVYPMYSAYSLSPSLQSLLRLLLEVNPLRRPKLTDLLAHSWCTSSPVMGESPPVSQRSTASFIPPPTWTLGARPPPPPA